MLDERQRLAGLDIGDVRPGSRQHFPSLELVEAQANGSGFVSRGCRRRASRLAPWRLRNCSSRRESFIRKSSLVKTEKNPIANWRDGRPPAVPSSSRGALSRARDESTNG